MRKALSSDCPTIKDQWLQGDVTMTELDPNVADEAPSVEAAALESAADVGRRAREQRAAPPDGM